MVFETGETVTDDPLPTKVPPQLPLYHCQFAPVPREPPTTVKVVFPPTHITDVPEIPIGATDESLTVIVADAQEVRVLQGAGSSTRA